MPQIPPAPTYHTFVMTSKMFSQHTDNQESMDFAFFLQWLSTCSACFQWNNFMCCITIASIWKRKKIQIEFFKHYRLIHTGRHVIAPLKANQNAWNCCKQPMSIDCQCLYFVTDKHKHLISHDPLKTLFHAWLASVTYIGGKERDINFQWQIHVQSAVC